MNNNTPNISKEVLKSRLEKIKESSHLQSHQSTTLSQPSSTSTSAHSSFITSSIKATNDKSPQATNEDHQSNINQEEIRNSFRQSLNSQSNINNKKKFSYFVQQANEMFQNYEKEISELKLHLRSFQCNKLFVVSSRSLSLGPSKEEKFNYKMKKMSEEESVSLDEIRIQYNKKLTELFKENAALSTMINKMSYDVVNALQEKIQELSKLLAKENQLKDKAQLELKSMDSVFQQNSDMKESLLEKDKFIIDLNTQLFESKATIESLQGDLESRAKMITALKEHADSKVKKINDQTTQIDDLRLAVNKLTNAVNKKDKEIKEKDEEIRLLFNDNVQWEDKVKLQLKEIENFKKWSLWDEDLLESYRKIETLQTNLEAKTKEYDEVLNENQFIKNIKEQLEIELNKKNQSLEELRDKNDNLTITKLTIEKKLEKYSDYDDLTKKNSFMKRELKTAIEKYENQLKTEKDSNEIQLQAIKHEHENELQLTVSKYDKKQLENSDVIQALECKSANYENDNKELNNQLDKKNQMLQNLKEVYENIVKKLKTQEEKIQSLEKRERIANSQTIIESTTIASSNNTPKVYSKFDKSAFTKEILIDYIFILFLFESSVNVQHLFNFLIGNINAYMNTIFQRNNSNTPMSVLSELLQDLFLISFDMLLKKKIKDNPKEAHTYIINFEQFDRETINNICDEIINKHPLSRFKDKKTLEEIENLFVGKYEMSFDFDESLKKYLNDEVIPIVTTRIEKYDKMISDEVHTLVEMSLNHLHDGKIIVNDEEIYSFEHYFNQYKHIESNDDKVDDDDDDSSSLLVNGNIKQPEAVDNICYRIKYNEPLEISFNNCFDKSSEGILSKIISTMMIYSSSITELSLKNNHLSGYIFKNKINKFLKVLRDLKTLDLSNNNLTDSDFKLLCNELKHMSLEALILDNNNLTSSAGFYLADVLIKNKALEVLSLSNNKITEKGLSTIFQILSNQNSTLTTLSISYNHFKKDDFASLGGYLSSNPVLVTLDISGNSIDPQSANVLGFAFKKAKSIKTLKANKIGLNEISTPQYFINLNETTIEDIELDQNILGESGTIIFINKIKTCVNLKRVSLRKCGIAPMFLELIAQTIKFCTTLEEINLECNPFDEASFMSFCKAIDLNNTIEIRFTKNGISNKAIEALEKINNVILV